MENEVKQKINTPMAIIIAGFLIFLGMLVMGTGNKSQEPKTLSEQVGVKKSQFDSCMSEFDRETFYQEIYSSVFSSTDGTAEGDAGTPYNIIIGKNGIKTEVRGAKPYESFKTEIDSILAGTMESNYTGNVPPINEKDHIMGNPNAEIVIIEYSDFECPFCKTHHATLKKLVEEYDGQVAWVFRHYPIQQLHPNAFEKAVASECISKIKGNEAFWKYTDLLFGLLKTSQDPVTDQL
jgi:thiol-disulfide isomerase/thioredoxin